MNIIKDSFSNIKASDEFKDKLYKELLNLPKELKPTKRKLYLRPIIGVATLLMIIGIISFKLMLNSSLKGNNNLDKTAYVSKEEEQINENTIKEEIQDNNNTTLPTEDIITPNNSDNELVLHVEKPSNENSVTKDVTSNVSSDITTVPSEKATSNATVSNEDKNIISIASISSVTSNIPVNSRAAINNNTLNVSFNSVYVPEIQLPKANTFSTANMLPLIVYNKKVYIYTPIEIPSENAKKLLGKKLGTTCGSINEYSIISDYSNEFASNIGITDVYAVNGYDEDFRIMTNIITEDKKNYPEFYECLNNITINNGKDIMEKLKLQGNITSAKFQTFNDWNNSTGIYYTINDERLINKLFNEINKATPYLPETIEDSLGDYRNDDESKQILFDLKDGSKNITLAILKSGYVYYGYPRIYLKIDTIFTKELWDKLSIM